MICLSTIYQRVSLFNMADREYFTKMIVCFFLLFVIDSCLGQEFENKCDSKLAGCYCTDSYIDCSGADFTELSAIYPYITNQTYRVHVTDGNLRSVPDNLFTSDDLNGPLSAVTYLNLSGNGIENVSPSSFQQLPNLKILDLSNNYITIDLCYVHTDLSSAFTALSNIEELYLRDIFNSNDVAGFCEPGNIFSQTNMKSLTILDMSSNSFNVIGTKMEDFLCETYTITIFNLSRNNFNTFPIPICMTNLIDLDISYNQIAVFSPDEIDSIESLVNIETLQLGGNPLVCDCYLETTFNWIKATEIPLDFDDIVCGGDTDILIMGQPINSLNFTEICEGPRIIVCYGPRGPITVSQTTFIAMVTVGFALLITIVTIVAVVCRRRRQHQKQRIVAGNSQMIPDVSKGTVYSRMV